MRLEAAVRAMRCERRAPRRRAPRDKGAAPQHHVEVYAHLRSDAQDDEAAAFALPGTGETCGRAAPQGKAHGRRDQDEDCRAHNPKVAGSNPAPATSERPADAGLSSFSALVPDPARVHLEMVREHPAPPGRCGGQCGAGGGVGGCRPADGGGAPSDGYLAATPGNLAAMGGLTSGRAAIRPRPPRRDPAGSAELATSR